MSHPECFEFCPRITECREGLITEMQTPAVTGQQEAAARLDMLVGTVAEVAVAVCSGPRIEERTIEKGGYFQSIKPTLRKVYVCGRDGFVQKTTFYYQKDKMPQQN